jgi:hypothetical protein
VSCVVLMFGMSMGCATNTNIMALVKHRAEFDMNCPADQLTVLDLGNRSYGVKGCETRASYVVIGCDAGAVKANCKVVLNSDELTE